MSDIKFTKEEVAALINMLAEAPYRYSAPAIQFFNQKLHAQRTVNSLEEVAKAAVGTKKSPAESTSEDTPKPE